MNIDVVERVVLALVALFAAAPELAHDRDLLLEEVLARNATEANRVELVVERADAEAGDDPPGPRDRFERAQQQSGVDRVPVRDERAGAEDEAVGDAGDK